MSKKINISNIVAGHFSTFKNDKSKYIKGDLFSFLFAPVLAALLVTFFECKISESIINVLVNAGAIFTGLLLNLLVLVYDQRSKLPTSFSVTKEQADLINWQNIEIRKNTLKQLYYNISYSTVISIGIVLLCIAELAISAKIYEIRLIDNWYLTINLNRYLLNPLLIFFGLNLVLTITMIIRKIYLLLTTE